MNRRDLLKLFGVGAVIAPAVSGIASPVTAMARIIEPPKVELIEPTVVPIWAAWPSEDKIKRISVVTEFESGRKLAFEAHGCTSEWSVRAIDVTTHSDTHYPDGPWRRYAPGPATIKMEFQDCSDFVEVK